VEPKMTIGVESNINFKDERIQNVVDIFLRKSKQTYVNFDYFDAIKVLEILPLDTDCSSINWSFFQKIFNKSIDEKTKQGICRLVFELIKNDCYFGDYLEIVETFKTLNQLGNQLYRIFSNSLFPFNLIVFPGNLTRKNRRSQVQGVFFTDCSNLFLSNLLKDFIIQNNTGQLNYSFYATFQESLNWQKITKITDFNVNTFKQQFYYYKNSENSSNSLTLLKKFYLRLLSLPEGRNLIHWRDGIDRNMLQTVSFNRNYEEGYKPIPLNPFDPVPSFDKWLVMPNGAENKSTKINSFSYKPIDFSLIKDDELKNGLKVWFWNSAVAIVTRIDQANLCIKFINFIVDLRNKYSIRKMTLSQDAINSITVEEIFSYVQYVKLNKKNNTYITVVKGFLTYLQESYLYTVEPSAYKFLVTKSKESNNSAQDIPYEDLEKIEAKFKENAKDNYINTLYYIIFHLSLATEFRISNIINLKIDCLIPGIKKDYYLESITKTSKGKVVKVPITPYTRRYVETAINFTREVRNECKDNAIKDHIFIHNLSTFNFKVVNVRSFSDYLKRTCLELGIEEYTAENLRDTYMTKSIEYAMKNNMSLMEMKGLTGHKMLKTTTNHYVAEKLKEYLEATHKIIIGNPVIKGNIVAKTDLGKEDLVNEECGYCPHESCIKKEDVNLDCLMCSGFYATVDRIPFYEEKIESLDIDIKSTNLQTEKDRLTTIKRLYLAYLEQLLLLKEEEAV
jgi:integrase